ncbi:MAG: glycosyltransferase family 4 protein [Phototrophicaceae bacterium]
MRILMIYSTSNLGGAELYAMNLLQTLKDKVQFTVVCPEGSFLSQRASDMGISTCEVPITYPLFDTSDLIQNVYEVMRQFNTDSFDLIYTHHLPAAVMGHILSSAWHIPLLLTIDSMYLRPAYEDFIRLASCYVMSASKSGYDYILSHDLCPQDQLFYVQPGINLKEFRTQQSKTRTQAFRRFDLKKQAIIGVVARLVTDKGVDIAIKAAHHMKQVGDLPAKVLIAGDGPERQTLSRLIEDLDMGDDVKFMGQVQPEEMPDFYQMMDIYVLATNREGCPISILESMASGVPVVATSVGDIPYLVQSGINGYTIEQPEPFALAQRITDIFNQDTFTHRARVHNEAIIPAFDNTIQAHKVYDIFRKILQDYGE